MFKILCLLTFALLTAASDDCPFYKNYVKSICKRVPDGLTLTSNPDNILVDKNNCNIEYNKSEWQQQPVIKYTSAEPDKSYTVVCIDPDAPKHRDGEYYLHWIVSNIRGQDLANGDLSKANHLTSYIGPAPPVNTGSHHYKFLVFEQEQLNQELNFPKNRPKFPLISWVEHQTNKLCGPVAGIEFRSKF